MNVESKYIPSCLFPDRKWPRRQHEMKIGKFHENVILCEENMIPQSINFAKVGNWETLSQRGGAIAPAVYRASDKVLELFRNLFI